MNKPTYLHGNSVEVSISDFPKNLGLKDLVVSDSKAGPFTIDNISIVMG